MTKILVTRRIPEPGLERLREAFSEVVVNPFDRDMSQAELIAGINGCNVILSMLSNRMDRDVIDAGRDLQGICNYAAGYNNIDVDYARSRGIIVTNTPDVLTETTADLAWALLMSAARRIAEGDRLMRQGLFRGWEPMLMLGMDIYCKTLGIAGLGRIGQAVARRACGFGMSVIYHNAHGPVQGLDFPAQHVTLEELLRQSDFISLHVPLNPQTQHLIGEKEFNLMKPTAVLVNTARGPVVDEQALVHALQSGNLFAAGLDVFENEPNLAPGLADLPNVVLAPHIGSASIDTRTAMALLAADNAIAILQGTQPPTPVRL